LFHYGRAFSHAIAHEKIFLMSDFIPPKPTGIKIGGLGPKAQRLQALREKAAKQKNGEKNFSSADTSVKAKDSFANTKKTSFQRKAT
jgi:hypothetical protein